MKVEIEIPSVGIMIVHGVSSGLYRILNLCTREILFLDLYFENIQRSIIPSITAQRGLKPKFKRLAIEYLSKS